MYLQLSVIFSTEAALDKTIPSDAMKILGVKVSKNNIVGPKHFVSVTGHTQAIHSSLMEEGDCSNCYHSR